MTRHPSRVLMVDDHPVVLAGLKALVEADTDFHIVGEARDGRTALQLAKQLLPEIVVLDISMPEMNGIEVATALLTEQPQCRVLVLTVHEDRAYLSQLLELGVSGYLLKRSASEELIRALHAIVAGGMYLDPAVAGKIVGRPARDAAESAGGPNGGPQRTRDRRAPPRRLRAQQQGNLGTAQHQREDRRDLQGARDGETRLSQPGRGCSLRRGKGLAVQPMTQSVSVNYPSL